MEITLYRDRELFSEARLLAAETYNMARILLGQSKEEHVFVPIRTMQYLAIIDKEEIVFVNSTAKNLVAIAWTNFHPQQRTSLQEPVPYVARYYRPDSTDTMLRLQSEFTHALRDEGAKRPHYRIARIIKLPTSTGDS